MEIQAKRKSMINTYNESNLHAALKKLYALEYNGKTEAPVDSWICDIETEDRSIIEIQTKNISKLNRKVQDLLHQGRKVTVVHPVIQKKIIETYAEDGTLISRRKSPREESIYSIFRELTGMYSVLTAPGFTLEVVFSEIIEQRRKVAKPTQLPNKSRRFLKNWIPEEKKLNAILKKKRLRTKEDYQELIPPNLPSPFTIPELRNAIRTVPEITQLNKASQEYAASQAPLIIWLYTHMDILKEAGKKGRSRLFTPG